MGCLGVIFLIILLALAFEYPEVSIPIIVIMVILSILGVRKNKTKAEEEERKRIESRNKAKTKYDEIKRGIRIPHNTLTVNYKGSSIEILKGYLYTWIGNDNLYFFPSSPPLDESKIEEIILFKIPITNIEYYATRGEVYRENRVTGGGGGGSSIGGTVVGGMIAGEAGAIIGSRKEGEPVKSELITHDTRETFLNFYYEGSKTTMFFDYNDYETFEEILPHKAYHIVSAIKANEIIVEHTRKNLSPADKIRELAKLKDEGIISESEFEEKKRELLDKIIE